MLTENVTGPVEPVTSRIYWSCKSFTSLLQQYFLKHYNKKNCIKLADNIYLYLFLSSCISIEDNLVGEIANKNSLNIYWPM